MFKKSSLLLLAAILVFSLTLAGCGNKEETSGEVKTVGEQVKYEIVGIDPGAGLMKLTKQAMEDYDLADWKLLESSGAAMTASLKKAYDKKEPIIVTSWTPHWMFSSFDLKYLEDPKGTYGDAEFIHTLVRHGLKEDMPNAYQVLDQFNWEPNDMADVMVLIEGGTDPKDAAAQWVEENAEKVSTWTEGVETANGEEITLIYVAWDSEIASTNVIGKVLEDLGFKVKLQQVEPGPMWAGIASGSADATVAAWLPSTHADYYAEFEGQFEDLGPNLEGTKLGLVVPTYMDIDSIEDLK